jgi:hypothetical protein
MRTTERVAQRERLDSTRGFSGAEGDSRTTSPAILLNAGRAQTREAMDLERAVPRQELFLRQLVDTASLFDRDPTAAHRGDHRGLATYYPSLCVRRWQVIYERRPGR